jgi:3',5'-cyclic AMP phosphodiesterase CpdA
MNTKLRNVSLLFLLAVSLRAADAFFFVQISDPQLGMITGNKDLTQEVANLEFAVATINRLRPAFVVVSGDMVNEPHDVAQLTEYRRVMSRVAAGIPVYHVAGNHDLGNAPSPAGIAAYTNHFGPDHYTFWHEGLAGIVLNSVIIHTPDQAAAQLAEQEVWLRAELARARDRGAEHIVVFAHHPWFLEKATEPDEYFNIPSQRRAQHLEWFREAGVKYLFSGHYHRNKVARDGELMAVTSGPVGKPLSGGKSGLAVVVVRAGALEYRFHDFGELPENVDLKPPSELRKP